MLLPELPVDEVALDLYWNAIYPPDDIEAERSSIFDVLALLSEMAGSDPDAIIDSIDGMDIGRDPQYHPNDLIAALITEIRRLRATGTT